MIFRTARYTVDPGCIQEATEAIEAFVAAVADREDRTRIYQAYRVGDRSFLHVMAFEDEAAEAAHRVRPHTSEFVSRLYPLCQDEPVFDDVEPVALWPEIGGGGSEG